MSTKSTARHHWLTLSTRLAVAHERLPGELCHGDQILGHIDPVADELRLYLGGPYAVTGLDVEEGREIIYRVAWRHPDNEDVRGVTRFPAALRLVVCVST